MNVDIRQVADKFGEYKIRGSEIIFAYCPYCKGGNHRDKGTSAMSIETGAFNCKRGSCGKKRSIYQICKDFAITIPQPFIDSKYVRPAKSYKLPKNDVKPITSTGEQYLLLRKISIETQKEYRVGSDAYGNIIFQYFEKSTDGKPAFIKYRPAHTVEKGERKSWRDADTKPLLYGMWLCDVTKPLCIFEGEIDAMSGHEAGIANCVSVPSGCGDMTWLDTCYDWLKQFARIYLFGDNDAPGREMQQKLLPIFTEEHRVFIVYHNCKDANDLLCCNGLTAIQDAYNNAHEIPVYGLIDLATVTPLDVFHIPHFKSGLMALDARIGGFPFGDVSILTGRRGEGKSTFVGQLALAAVNQGNHVCLYSGEMRADRVQYLLNLQAAGPANIKIKHDNDLNRDCYLIEKPILEKIKAWYSGKFFLYDNSISDANESDSILKVFIYAVKRYDCKFFAVDNLMTCRYTGNDRDFYRQQSSLVGDFVAFAKHYNVHVLICAHPRKTSGSISNDDISGSADISNRADNVFSIERLYKDEKEVAGCDAVLSILKNRGDGANGEIGLNFEAISRRLYVPSEGQMNYSWQLKELGYDNIMSTNQEEANT